MEIPVKKRRNKESGKIEVHTVKFEPIDEDTKETIDNLHRLLDRYDEMSEKDTVSNNDAIYILLADNESLWRNTLYQYALLMVVMVVLLIHIIFG